MAHCLSITSGRKGCGSIASAALSEMEDPPASVRGAHLHWEGLHSFMKTVSRFRRTYFGYFILFRVGALTTLHSCKERERERRKKIRAQILGEGGVGKVRLP